MSAAIAYTLAALAAVLALGVSLLALGGWAIRRQERREIAEIAEAERRQRELRDIRAHYDAMLARMDWRAFARARQGKE